MADLREIYVQNRTAIDEIDEKLDSLSDGESVGKRKVGNQLVEDSKSHWEDWLAGVVKQLNEMDDDEIRAGVYLAVTRGLKEEFDKNVQELVASKVKDAPKVEPLISQEEAAELSKVRSSLFAQLKSVVELATAVGDVEDGNNWDMPKIRRGAHGKRGKRALSLYSWYFNGEEVEDIDTVKDVSKYLGFEKAADFTKALRDAGVDTRNPEDEFSWTAPNGVVVTAVKDTDEDDGDENGEDGEGSEEE